MQIIRARFFYRIEHELIVSRELVRENRQDLYNAFREKNASLRCNFIDSRTRSDVSFFFFFFLQVGDNWRAAVILLANDLFYSQVLIKTREKQILRHDGRIHALNYRWASRI